MQAWGNGGKLAGVTYHCLLQNTSAGKLRNLGTLTWTPQPANPYGASAPSIAKPPASVSKAHPTLTALVDYCPGNLTLTIGTSDEQQDWCFAKSATGTWSVLFSAPRLRGQIVSYVIPLPRWL